MLGDAITSKKGIQLVTMCIICSTVMLDTAHVSWAVQCILNTTISHIVFSILLYVLYNAVYAEHVTGEGTELFC